MLPHLSSDASHWAFGQDIEVLPRIFEDGITLAVMQRRLDPTLTLAVRAQLSGTRPLDWHWRGAPGQAMQQDLLRRLPAPEAGAALAEDVGHIAEAMAYLFSTDTIGIRLRTLEGAMCPRFHVDNLAVRLVTTYAGPASEWLPEHAVNRAGLGAPHPDKPDIVADPAAIQRLGVGDLALLKGCGWIGNEEHGLVHRSPQPAEGERRLLLALDPG
ncbi:DUF1826 domain-containing protein [Billgrantia kenyensis]|uniref:DUF1826 domain-containing protein n=1 Tax=Billgrantia kenyensis TaxID=321266 RepID=A0A7W0AFW8_9GAMM|nr:DUF1826 domain-containing protein [Halomonas kenyensis]MBA2781135.1 DUF1826 domain-containing protein [Halomonas kenyensis]MCG6662557.1 DUF1826 domain-containing protein [Halomonas kenyensis]